MSRLIMSPFFKISFLEGIPWQTMLFIEVQILLGKRKPWEDHQKYVLLICSKSKHQAKVGDLVTSKDKVILNGQQIIQKDEDDFVLLMDEIENKVTNITRLYETYEVEK